MSATEPDIVTIRLVDYDTSSWIWVPHIWPHEGFAGPESWADAVSRTVAKRSWLQFVQRRAFRADLLQMSLSRDGESTNWTLAYAPSLSRVPRIVRIDAHDRVTSDPSTVSACTPTPSRGRSHSTSIPGRGRSRLARRTEPLPPRHSAGSRRASAASICSAICR
ncbi:hypothetical protein [Microbacterium sp.]|uniref:hypothetical protein n=1 Tax=Microbacterium sp. TaxID=51671 RepID=UPI002FE171F9